MAAPMPGVNQATINAVRPEILANAQIGGQVAPQYQKPQNQKSTWQQYISPAIGAGAGIAGLAAAPFSGGASLALSSIPLLLQMFNSMNEGNSEGGGFFGDQPEQFRQWNRFNPQQQQGFNQMLQMMMQNIDPRAAEKDIMNQFQTQEIPSIAARFAGMGEGMQGSSAFQGALGTAMKNYGQGMAGMRHQMGMGMAPYAFAPQYEQMYQQSQPSGFANMMAGALPAIGQGLGSYFGGRSMSNAIDELGKRFPAQESK